MRDLTAGMLAELGAAKLRPILLYEGVFAAQGSPPDDGYLRLWSGTGTVSWNGYLWTGAGNLLAISPLQETSEIQATGFTVTLSGMPSANIATALAATRQGMLGNIWLGCLTQAGAVIADPFLARQGRLDVPSIDDAGDTCTISVQYEDRLVDLERPRERRYTNEDQHLDYPLDQGFEFVPALQDAQAVWAAATG